jgi:hypothetical protein
MEVMLGILKQAAGPCCAGRKTLESLGLKEVAHDSGPSEGGGAVRKEILSWFDPEPFFPIPGRGDSQIAPSFCLQIPLTPLPFKKAPRKKPCAIGDL